MPAERFFIAINGGHTKSVACAISVDLGAVEVVEGESLNFHTYPHQVITYRFDELIDKLAHKVGVRLDDLRSCTERIALSMPGAGTTKDQALIEVCLLRPEWKDPSKYLILDDTWAGLVAGTLSSSGSCVFAGTGASIYMNDILGRQMNFFGKPNQIDGWGPIIGDFGSGFQLTVDMFRMFNREFDKGSTPELFHKVLEQEPDIGDMTNAQRWFDTLYIRYSYDWRIRFAKLASSATTSADSADPYPCAKALVEKAANDIIESVEIALGNFPGAKVLPVVFQGGMFEHSKLYRRVVSEKVEKLASGPVYLALFRPVVGALMLALGDLNVLPDQSTISDLHRAIKAMPQDERCLLIRAHGRAPFGKEEFNGR